ncbi:DUF721 domain-containing protein [Rhodobacteraceae bacterium 2376]|uniref:DUF721 domain-containing protein n=1 Tax=Rhabdonatronobacter sediminivivens TaxID=2743469 RepID=A0A7Z0HY64_9RHOB|nr:DUF721 domain-containing protein [Rhabdonatronobacter sediminivivens]NYS24044.1 DUF721 domain-containing protein [Rhabdonatronobacter sediminivivens]
MTDTFGSRPPGPGKRPVRRGRGFEPAAGLLRTPLRKISESRGFAVARLLTHWPEIVGEDTARLCRPVRVSYARKGMGATLSLLVPGAQAPLVEMQKDRIRERVNACYGYNAIARIALTQTAPTGFAEGQTPFAHAPGAGQAPEPQFTAQLQARAQGVAADVGDETLRSALEKLALNVLAARNRSKGH